ncbi:MAG TPA: excinuclease ABC subunit UvrC [Alphaproteobacteria bacterium]
MSLESGIATIKAQAKLLPETPGVYRMLGEGDRVLYVGKARALRRRVTSYTQQERLTKRLMRMVAETVRMEIIHTHTEVEALLLEANLIKKLKPHYNILLKDDKSFPYIHIESEHDFPKLEKFRGMQRKGGDFFGPFASAYSVNETIALLQKVFQLRNCSDTIFSSRTRPCLQYHIKRCTAPCVDYVTREQYAAQVELVRDFLSGKSRDVVDRFSAAMEKASEDQDYEEAAKYRDHIRALSHIQLQQDINVLSMGDADVFALVRKEGQVCVQVFFFRAGQNFGNRSYFPRASEDDSDVDILEAFLPQFYANRPPPKTILLSQDIPEDNLIEKALQELHQLPYSIAVLAPARGDKRRVIDFVLNNAKLALERHLIERAGDAVGLSKVQEIFELDDIPQRIEIYDNAHVQGTNKVGGMVVAGPEGLRKNAYRKFNIKSDVEGDDYQMMREVMTRRFGRAIEEGLQGDAEFWPDLLLIDGGVGQLNAVYEALAALGVDEDVHVVAISKGPDRNAGREWFHQRGKEPFQLPVGDVGLMYMQRLRDEAHRFANGAHAARRGKSMIASSLDEIPNIGPTRKKALLAHFGSGKAVENAGLKDLQEVPGISKSVAQQIYDHYHGS